MTLRKSPLAIGIQYQHKLISLLSLSIDHAAGRYFLDALTGQRLFLSVADHFFIDTAQHTVDKLTAGISAKSLGQFNGFVNSHFGRYILGHFQFVDTDAQDITIGGGDLFQRPLWSKTGYQAVYKLLVLDDVIHQLQRKTLIIKIRGEFLFILLHYLGCFSLATTKVPFVKSL